MPVIGRLCCCRPPQPSPPIVQPTQPPVQPTDGGVHTIIPPIKPEPEGPDNGGGSVGLVVPPGGPETGALKAADISAGAGIDAGSTRAAAIAGVMFGILAAASGLAWALYKFKPGLIPFGGAAPGRGGAAARSAAAPLLGAGAPGADATPVAASAPAPDGLPASATGAGGAGLDTTDVGTMTAAGYRSSAAAGAGGAYARGYGLTETSQRLTTESMFSGGANGAAGSPTSTMNRGIQTDVANGPVGGAGLAAAGGAASSTFMTSTVVKDLYSSQQDALVDGSVSLSITCD